MSELYAEIERLTRELAATYGCLGNWRAREKALLADFNAQGEEIERLRAALKWYAKADYDRRICDDGDGHIDAWGGEEILEDKGKRAREALGEPKP